MCSAFRFCLLVYFDLLPRAIIPPFLSNSGRDTFVDLSRIFRDTRNDREWSEPFTNERVL